MSVVTPESVIEKKDKSDVKRGAGIKTKLSIKLPEDIQTVFDKSTCLHNKSQVEAALDTLAAEISRDLAESNPIFLCVVVGGMIPLGHLLVRLDFPLEVDYIHVTRYRGETKGGELQWKANPSTALKNRTIIVVDDILDSGLTMQAIVDYCWQQEAKAVYTAALVEKLGAQQPGGLQVADYTGLKVDNRYVFGYGLDYKEYLRNAPGIYAVAAEHE